MKKLFPSIAPSQNSGIPFAGAKILRKKKRRKEKNYQY